MEAETTLRPPITVIIFPFLPLGFLVLYTYSMLTAVFV